jgi:Ni,Fe-hydrogenase I cytochrome b subunit
MNIKTWHIELFTVAVILSSTTFITANNLVNWITTLAILVTFNHGIIGDRLQERQSKMDKPTVECYYKLNRLFAIKEVIWITAFFIMKNYAAIVGSVLFFLYPFWRKFYRSKIKPLQ